MTKQCKNCNWFDHTNFDTGVTGYCRAYGPSVAYCQSDSNWYSDWPVVYSHLVCPRWSPVEAGHPNSIERVMSRLSFIHKGGMCENNPDRGAEEGQVRNHWWEKYTHVQVENPVCEESNQPASEFDSYGTSLF